MSDVPTATLQMPVHYVIQDGLTMERLRQSLREPEAWSREDPFDLNWVFLSTSGVHGNCATLDDVFNEPMDDGSGLHYITAMVFRPRLCTVWYGQFPITRGDAAYLRQCVAQTLDAVARSQQGNLP